MNTFRSSLESPNGTSKRAKQAEITARKTQGMTTYRYIPKGIKSVMLWTVLGCSMLYTSASLARPNVDFRGYSTPRPTWAQADTFCRCETWWMPGWYTLVPDRMALQVPGPTGVSLLGFMHTYAGDRAPSGQMIVTTFYGIDADPSLPDSLSMMTGFNAGNPEAIIANEVIIGLAREYPAAPLGAFRVGEMSHAAPFLGLGTDFSYFVGDPQSVIYAFQVTVPIADFALSPVPEPSSALLTGMGAVGLACVLLGRRRREKRGTQYHEAESACHCGPSSDPRRLHAH